MSSFAPRTRVTCDVFFEKKNANGQWERVLTAGTGVDAIEAQRLISHPDRPKGSRFVCKVNR